MSPMPAEMNLPASALRAELLALLACDHRFEAERAACVARWLDSLPEGDGVILCGCGGLGRRLTREHPHSLARLRLMFASTYSESTSFEGFPRTDATGVAKHTTHKVLLLSGTYEAEMREGLPGVAPERIFALRVVLREAANADDLRDLWKTMKARARELAKRLDRELPTGRSAACFLLPNFGLYALSVLACVRATGWTVVVITHADLPMPEAEMRACGYLDLLHVEASPEALRLVLTSLFSQAVPFQIVHAWTSLSNHSFLASLVRAGVPLVASVDTAMPPLMESTQLFDTLCEELDTDRGVLFSDWHAMYTGAAGIIVKDSPLLEGHFRRKYSASPRRLMHMLPPVGPAPAGPPARLAREGPMRVVFIGSLHRSARRRALCNMPAVYDVLYGFISRGISLTIINNLDTGTGYEDMKALAKTEQLFDYHPRMPFERLAAEICGFDFGLLWAHPALTAELPLLNATNMQTKLCVHIQAGLPSLVPTELIWCADLTRDLGLGLVYSHQELDDLGTMLASFDREKCLDTLSTARETLGIAPHAARLAAFLREAAEGACGERKEQSTGAQSPK
ncbi:MAG: hypothetical protein Q7U56_10100 [Humidesulfovibrio sp.]|nr:hypothetical protein [Humidesulfovibrio sp.]